MSPPPGIIDPPETPAPPLPIPPEDMPPTELPDPGIERTCVTRRAAVDDKYPATRTPGRGKSAQTAVVLEKLTSGRWLLTVAVGATFCWMAGTGKLEPDAAGAIIGMVFIAYFQRGDRSGNGKETA